MGINRSGGTTTHLGIFANSIERITVDGSNGYVGITYINPVAKLTVGTSGLGVTQQDWAGMALINTSAAAAGAQQISPPIRWRGTGWKTNATAASQVVDFRNYLLPVQGTVNPSSTLVWESSINGGAYTTAMSITNTGNLVVNGNLTSSSAGFTIGSNGATTLRSFATTSMTANGTAGTIAVVNDAVSALLEALNPMLTLKSPRLFKKDE